MHIGSLCLALCAGLVATAMGSVPGAQSPRYRYSVVLDSTSGAHTNFGVPRIDEEGRIVVDGSALGGGSATILRAGDGDVEVLATVGADGIAALDILGVRLVVRGTNVLFGATLVSGEKVLLKHKNGVLTQALSIADLPIPPEWGTGEVSFTDWDMNTAEAIACNPSGGNGHSALFIRTASAIVKLISYGNASPGSSSFIDYGPLRLLDDNSILVEDRRWDRPGPYHNGMTWLSSTGAQRGTMAISGADGASYFWDATSDGVVFVRLGTDVVSGVVGDTFQTILSASCAGPIMGTFGLSVNDRSALSIVAGVGNCTNAEYVAMSSHTGTLEPILSQGDILFGRIVESVQMAWRGAINSRGQVALRVFLRDPISMSSSLAIVRATPRKWPTRR